MTTSRQPDYRVGAINTTTGVRGNIGAAWDNSDKTISIKLDAFVVLPPSHEITITLFPNDRRTRK